MTSSWSVTLLFHKDDFFLDFEHYQEWFQLARERKSLHIFDISSLKVLSSQKRGRSRGVSIDSSCLPAQSLTFFWTLQGLLSCFKFKKPVSAFRAKKGGVFFDVESATKNSEARYDIPL